MENDVNSDLNTYMSSLHAAGSFTQLNEPFNRHPKTCQAPTACSLLESVMMHNTVHSLQVIVPHSYVVNACSVGV